jgi:diguanylate cyclase (GGDEF)-like protein/PAS domain S-box-containing protein
VASRRWSDRELEEFVRGKILTLFHQGSYVPVPETLVAIGGEPTPYQDTMDITARIHPDDGSAVTDMTIAAWSSPGEVARGTYRFRWGDEWMWARSEVVVLTDDRCTGMLSATVLEPLAEEHEEKVLSRTDRSGADVAVHWMLVTLDVAGVVLSAEGAVEQMLGRDPASIIGVEYREFLHPDARNDLYASWIEMLHRPESTRVARRCLVRPDGTEQWSEVAYVNRLEPDRSGDVLLFAVDITDRIAQEEELRRTQEELRLLAEQVPTAVFRAEADGRVTFTNHRWRDLLGALATVEHVADLAGAEDRARVEALFDERRSGGRGIELATGCGRRLALNVRDIRDPLSGRTTFVGSVDDVTVTSMLRHQADHDDLTGLLTRRAFEERVGQALDDEPGQGVVGFIDLDRFKAVNDDHGHVAGDAVLTSIAHRLRRALRDGDLVGRYGGDEFIVFCPDTEDIGAVVGRLGRACDEPVAFDGGSWSPAVSIGVAVAQAGETVSDLVRRADQEMFSVKRAQRAEARGGIRGGVR